ncbi:hypothetical protein [uncultured Methanobrevibacter sp.]|uniref:hypothetical protein n=1 Tax=uncultured Methanobrevibacter sp. TaxID=253161 RepID=UPI0025E1F1AA|nr:hypothetical protein [uncultured Methanobrevibacter sp.]
MVIVFLNKVNIRVSFLKNLYTTFYAISALFNLIFRKIFIVYSVYYYCDIMMTKTIKISQDTHKSLSELASKNDTFNDVIRFLIDYYKSNEEFTDEEAEFYNNEIEKFENDNLENLNKLSLKSLEERITKLENEIKK